MIAAVALAIAAALQTPAAAFERAAAEAERFVDTGCVLYDRAGDSRSCDAQAGTSLRGPYPVADLVALTRHADARVRTLALLHLFATGDPKLLPAIFALTRDTADTFPAHTPVAMLTPGGFNAVPKTPQTVGDIAERMVRFYLERAGYEYGSAGVSSCPGFDDYWRQRRDRTRLASWFTVQLDRATQGTTPIPANRESRFTAVRAAVDRLDGDDRLWYALFVGAAEGGERVFSEAETLSVAKTLGPDRLMQMLTGRAPASDPDLVPVGRPASCGARDVGAGMRRFVLARAALLLRPADADVLLQSPDAQYALWAIAAASLRPDRAEAILKPAIAKLDRNTMGWDQASMAAALPRLAGLTHVPYALDWFYGRGPNEPMTNAQEIFIARVMDSAGNNDRALLERLINDPRFDRISPSALRALILRLNGWLASPLVEYPYQSLREDQDRARFAEWRRLVRESVPRWIKPG